MKLFCFTAIFFCFIVCCAAESENPYKSPRKFFARNDIDRIMIDHWRQQRIQPSDLCSDASFIRRIHLDLTGTLPPREKVKRFLGSDNPDKRTELIDNLLASDEFTLYYTLRWCDILRVKSEFPIKMWPNAVQAYHQWIWNALRNNQPYNQFARELLTTSGSNFREPAVNFYRGTQDRSPLGLAQIAALTFLGSRLETWPESQQHEFAKLFSRLAFKGTAEWKEEIVYLNPAPHKPFTVSMPNGILLTIGSLSDPRKAFADWLTAPGNIWFAQAAVNRTWFWLFGRGIVHEPDDFQLVSKQKSETVDSFWRDADCTNLGNPPVSRELLDFLAQSFIQSGYDFRTLCRLITSSSVYQQSCIASSPEQVAEAHLAVYPLRRLDAEVLIDAFTEWGDLDTQYVSIIPEPFTFIPPEQRTIGLADGSISSAFLETFGRPARDTGRLTERNSQVTYSQRLYLLNSPQIIWKVSNGPLLEALLEEAENNPMNLVRNIYLTLLSRPPAEEEIRLLSARYPGFNSSDPANTVSKTQRQTLRKGGMKLMWALINSKEFLFQH